MTKQFRRCHVCGTINELHTHRDNMVHSCDGCGKHLAPFYFFEESEQSGVADNGLQMSLRKEAIGYQPLWGFSAYWSVEGVTEGTDLENSNHERQSGRYPKGSRKD